MRTKRVLLLALLWLPVPAACLRASGAPSSANRKTIAGVVDYAFLFDGIARLPAFPVGGDWNAVKMLLWIQPKRCVGFECTREGTAKSPEVVVEIRSANLLLVAADKTLVPIHRTSGPASDNDLAVVCPEMREEQTVDLGLPLNKWDLAMACGQKGEKILKPIDVELVIELKLFSFTEGKQVAVGALLSEPFFVRVTQDTFEIKGIPFPDRYDPGT